MFGDASVGEHGELRFAQAAAAKFANHEQLPQYRNGFMQTRLTAKHQDG